MGVPLVKSRGRRGTVVESERRPGGRLHRQRVGRHGLTRGGDHLGHAASHLAHHALLGHKPCPHGIEHRSAIIGGPLAVGSLFAFEVHAVGRRSVALSLHGRLDRADRDGPANLRDRLGEGNRGNRNLMAGHRAAVATGGRFGFDGDRTATNDQFFAFGVDPGYVVSPRSEHDECVLEIILHGGVSIGVLVRTCTTCGAEHLPHLLCFDRTLTRP